MAVHITGCDIYAVEIEGTTIEGDLETTIITGQCANFAIHTCACTQTISAGDSKWWPEFSTIVDTIADTDFVIIKGIEGHTVGGG